MRAWCISEGSLWFVDGDAPAQQLESAFAQEAVARAERDRQRNAWKTAPRESSRGIIPGNVLWGARAGGAQAPIVPPKFRHAVRGKDADSLYYLLELNGSTGLFHYRISEKRETRIFHHANFRSLGMAYDAERDLLIIATGNRDGTANLAVYDKDGNAKGTITGGDAVDAAPSCSMYEKGVVLFQSAGVARHPQGGQVMAVGPSAINRLHYGTGEMETILEDRAYDFLAPREDRAGNVYYIRRPYERSARERTSSFLTDVLLFPWRLLLAIFGWLNFFSTIYGREPLRSAGTPKDLGMEQDVRSLWLHGRMVQLSQPRDGALNGLVPSSWQLRRRSRNGDDSFVADHVVSFDLCDDGSLCYSNGYEVFHIFQGNPRSRKHSGIIESVSAA